jgi:CAP-Gly domain-containing linker protein 1
MITPGSRASKYVGMTAKQLTSRDAEKGGSISSTSSPVRLGTMATPKPRTSTTGGAALPTPKSSRLSFATPGHTPKQSRYVVPSSSRPPVPDLPQGLSISPLPGLPNDGFAKPHTPTFSQTSSETFVDEMSEDSRALELNGRALQDKIASLMSGPSKARHLSPDEQSSDRESERSRSMSWLQGRIDSLEGENRKLRADIVILAEKASVSSNPEDAQLLSAARGKNEVLEEEKKRLAARIVELEAQTKIDARALKERQDKIESVERSAQSATDHADKIRLEGESKVRDALSKLADSEALVNSLKEAIQMNTSAASENHAVLQAKDAEITLLETRVARATADLEEERRELGGQVDELRRAGQVSQINIKIVARSFEFSYFESVQETIALYEERLNASDTRRYEMEDLIQALEEQLRKQAEPVSPTALTQQANTAAQIDNETLREQATHLQKKILMLEEQLDDARASQERDDAAAQARITRYRENDAALRKDIAELKAEMDKNARAEMAARTRAEEIAEALRENGVALEDARAEIETLRSELAVSLPLTVYLHAISLFSSSRILKASKMVLRWPRVTAAMISRNLREGQMKKYLHSGNYLKTHAWANENFKNSSTPSLQRLTRRLKRARLFVRICRHWKMKR